MFAKLAQFPMFNRIVGRRFGAVACNDNQPIRRFIAPLRRQILHCHWHKAASGALECGWFAEATSASKVEEPDIKSAAHPSQRAYITFAPRSFCYFRTYCGVA
jgi:hypothetical protein